MTLQLQTTLSLGRSASYYASDMDFAVEMVSGTCGIHLDSKNKNKPHELTLDVTLRPHLLRFVTTGFRCNLERITEAALRFYAPKGAPNLVGTLYDETLFLLRRDCGLYMDTTQSGNSIGQAPVGQGLRTHGEATGHIIEMLAYGVAIEFMCSVLKINRDRFYFITGHGSRPDFAAQLSPAILGRLNMRALNLSGAPIYIEVKGRTTDTGSPPQDCKLLVNLAKKCERNTDGAFVAMTVNVPKNASTATWPAKIQVYDPGEPVPLQDSQQVAILLSQVLFQACRFGLWGTAAACLADPWIEYLRPLSDAEIVLAEYVGRSAPSIQGSLVSREIEGREYRGRFFYSGLEALGGPGARLISVDEARAMLGTGNFGQKTFRGIDLVLEEIVVNGCLEDLMAWGRADTGISEGIRAGGFVSLPAPEKERQISEAEHRAIASVFADALRRYDMSHTW